MKLPFTIYDSRLTIWKKSAGGTGVAPVVSGVAPETRPQGKAALHLVSPNRAVRSQVRSDAGFDRRDACSTRFVFNPPCSRTVAAGRQSSIENHKFQRGFTLVEIAISLAIIGIALVGILAALPRGLQIQSANREQTVINQDATVFMEAIRGGERGLDDLTNYVYAITNYWTIYSANGSISLSGTNGYTYAASYYSSPPSYPSFQINSGARIIGLLSSPEYASPDQPSYVPLDNIVGVSYVSNHIVAYVRSISGPAVEKPPQANDSIVREDSFSYRVLCVNAPLAADTNAAVNAGYTRQLTANLRELRLTFLWPQLPSGGLGPGRQTYRAMVAGQLVTTNDPSGQVLYSYQPQSFAANTNAP
jgi:prepilin-type N-terminal cleavage/methylation domain-containing protein